jgi:Fur family transcriptional regulator, iron response regulator
MRDGGPLLTGCPWHDVNAMLQARVFARPGSAWRWAGCCSARARHLTAEMLYEEATLAKVPVSLATVYNTLNQLTDAGLLRQVSVDGTKTHFDTNVTAHHHFYLEHNHELVGIPDPHVVLHKMRDVRKAMRFRASIWSFGFAKRAVQLLPSQLFDRYPAARRRWEA